MKKIIFLIFLAAVFDLCAADRFDVEKTWKSEKVAAAVGKVYMLKQQYDVGYSEGRALAFTGAEWDAYHKAYGDVFQDKSGYGDCMVVQLLAWCPDGDITEDIYGSIISRGKKMMFVLKYALNHPPILMNEKEKECWLNSINVLRETIATGKAIGSPYKKKIK